jgi:FlaA1/EpsC-like NDP-sugar epimerase
MMAIDAIWLPICLWLSYCLRLSSWWPLEFIGEDWWIFIVVSLVGVIIFSQMSVYRTILRYAGLQAVIQILKGVGLLSLALMALVFLVGDLNMPRSVPIIFFLVGLMYVGGTRLFYRFHYQWMLQRHMDKESILIYGAGVAGAQISLALADSAEYKVIAFLDDNKQLHGSLVQGKRVYSTDKLDYLIDAHRIKRILLAMPSSPRETRRRIVERIKPSKVKVLTLPSMPEIVTGEAKVDLIKKVEIEDLLGRDPIPPRKELLHESIKDKTVLITGAGGSIGSEICRQIIQLAPRKIILNDHSEYNLYAIEQELLTLKEEKKSQVHISAILGSVCDKSLMSEIMENCDIQTVYHAAAYKHVPMIEKNILVGLENNIFGTQTVCECALKNGVERFVLISTDKAVRPTNIMGATKRTAELVVQDMAAHSKKTIFCMVRFGNVLGSSGSVIPLFRKQIAKGGPVTVTHPDITRYFMTINEAAALVIQAGSMATGGEVFVLDMGEEVKILSLAKQIIHLSGLEVCNNDEDKDGDIQITFTGLRPGEKIREELLIGDNVTGTEHPRIMRALEDKIPKDKLTSYLSELKLAKSTQNALLAKSVLVKTVAGYKPQEEIADSIFIEKSGKTFTN